MSGHTPLLRIRIYREVVYAGFAGAKASMRPRDTTAKDGGSADHAGAIISPPIPGGHVLLLRIHAHAGYRPSLDIKKPGRGCLPGFRVFQLEGNTCQSIL